MQYPDIEAIARADLKALRRILGIVQYFAPLQGLDGVYREVRAMVLSELDFCAEAENTRKIAANFGRDYYVERSRTGGKADELWAAVGRDGYIGVNLPEEYGGGGMGMQELAIVAEELAASGSPLLITQITDPFGRAAQLTYDSSGRLSSITDPVGITSSFTYSGTEPTFVTQLTTPYGTSTFSDTPNPNDTPETNTRSLTLTDPLGYTHYLYYYQNPAVTPASESPWLTTTASG